MGGNKVHQSRREAVVRLEMQLFEPRADGRHLIGRRPRLDDRGHKRGELGGRPAALLRKLSVDEIEPIERMLRVLDAAVHMRTTTGAGVSLNGGIGVPDLELVGVLGDTEFVARHNGDLRE
jgi:hypothetical protein